MKNTFLILSSIVYIYLCYYLSQYNLFCWQSPTGQSIECYMLFFITWCNGVNFQKFKLKKSIKLMIKCVLKNHVYFDRNKDNKNVYLENMFQKQYNTNQPEILKITVLKIKTNTKKEHILIYFCSISIGIFIWCSFFPCSFFFFLILFFPLSFSDIRKNTN